MSNEEDKLIDSEEDSEESDSEIANPEDRLPWCVRYAFWLKLIFVPVFFFIGVMFFKLFEGWSYITAMYVCMQIVTTVGYGDLTSTSDGTRMFMTIYVLLIIVFVAAIVNDIGNYLIEKEAIVLRKGFKQVADGRQRGRAPRHLSVWDRYHLCSLLTSTVVFLVSLGFGTIFYALYESCSCSYGVTHKSNFADCIDAAGPQYNCNMQVPGADLGTTYGATKSWVEALYMSVITMTTVGFGDFAPLSIVGRMIGTWWMFLGVLATAKLVSSISTTMNAVVKGVRKQSKSSRHLMAKIDANNTGSLSKDQHLRYVILKHDMLTEADLDHIDQVFDAMDPDGTGSVDIAEIKEHMAHDES